MSGNASLMVVVFEFRSSTPPIVAKCSMVILAGLSIRRRRPAARVPPQLGQLWQLGLGAA
jgi:hypothetical protein